MKDVIIETVGSTWRDRETHEQSNVDFIAHGRYLVFVATRNSDVNLYDVNDLSEIMLGGYATCVLHLSDQEGDNEVTICDVSSIIYDGYDGYVRFECHDDLSGAVTYPAFKFQVIDSIDIH